MNLDELVERQQQELSVLHKAKERSWQALRTGHHTLIEAFGGYENVNDDYKAKMQQEIEAFHTEWHSEDGHHFRETKERHEQERFDLTRHRPVDAPSAPSQNADKSYWKKRQATINQMKTQSGQGKEKNRGKGRGM